MSLQSFWWTSLILISCCSTDLAPNTVVLMLCLSGSSFRFNKLINLYLLSSRRGQIQTQVNAVPVVHLAARHPIDKCSNWSTLGKKMEQNKRWRSERDVMLIEDDEWKTEKRGGVTATAENWRWWHHTLVSFTGRVIDHPLSEQHTPVTHGLNRTRKHSISQTLEHNWGKMGKTFSFIPNVHQLRYNLKQFSSNPWSCFASFLNNKK